VILYSKMSNEGGRGMSDVRKVAKKCPKKCLILFEWTLVVCHLLLVGYSKIFVLFSGSSFVIRPHPEMVPRATLLKSYPGLAGSQGRQIGVTLLDPKGLSWYRKRWYAFYLEFVYYVLSTHIDNNICIIITKELRTKNTLINLTMN